MMAPARLVVGSPRPARVATTPSRGSLLDRCRSRRQTIAIERIARTAAVHFLRFVNVNKRVQPA